MKRFKFGDGRVMRDGDEITSDPMEGSTSITTCSFFRSPKSLKCHRNLSVHGREVVLHISEA